MSPMPPITIAYLAAALEQDGVDVSVYDDVLHGADEVALSNQLRETKPDLVAISVVTGTVSGAERAAAIVRKYLPEAKIVMGNIHADLFYDILLQANITDFVVHAEGEVTLVELVREMAKLQPDYSVILGLSFIEDGVVYKNEPRPYIQDLDSLPFPAWHLFPIDRYKIFSFAQVKDPGTLILGSRGCPFNCTFCTLVLNQSTTRRRRSTENIVDECEYLFDRFGYRQVSFVDPIFPFHRQEGIDFAEEMERRGLHKKQVWITETRVDLVDYDLLSAMKAGGLRRIMFGFETGNQEQLARIRKGAKLDAGVNAARAAKKAGISVVGFFMLGLPGSTTEDLQATIDYATKALDIDFAKFTVFVPYPGTPDYKALVEENALAEPENWELFTSYPTKARPPAYIPDNLCADDIIHYQKKAYASFYLRPRMVARQLLKLRTLGVRDMVDGIRLMSPLPSS